jgi:hypothetical protein
MSLLRYNTPFSLLLVILPTAIDSESGFPTFCIVFGILGVLFTVLIIPIFPHRMPFMLHGPQRSSLFNTQVGS